MDEIGLFPLDLVLLPGEQAPLHIFEPRYRELIGECLEDGTEFGILLEDEAARIHLHELTEGRSFQTAEVEELPDEGETPSEDEVEECLAAYARVVDAAEAELEDLDLDADSIAFQIAARIDFGTEIKQGILELRSERERVVRLSPMLNRAAEAVAREKEIRERASGNGRVEPL
jgi:Lon protease-like protein